LWLEAVASVLTGATALNGFYKENLMGFHLYEVLVEVHTDALTQKKKNYALLTRFEFQFNEPPLFMRTFGPLKSAGNPA
jgi:hypothetical protein